jgi:hypothetical protein
MEEVLRAEPERAEAYNSLGFLASRRLEPKRAISYWEQAIKLRPNYAQAHFSLGLALLQIGDYERGFAECEWRWRTEHPGASRFAQPRWDGRPIQGRTLLVLAQRGTADAIQFARYLPLAAERCGTLIVACPAELRPILTAVSGIARLCDVDEIAELQFDYYLPLLSRPYAFRTTFATVPTAVPYIDATLLTGTSDRRLAPLASALPRVGLSWRSQTTPKTHDSSCAPGEFHPILRIPDIAFYDLESPQGTSQLAQLPAEVTLQEPSPPLTDIADLALMIDQLDLVIGVDGPAVHLAGAMGKPAWVLLTYVPEWRWLLTGKTTPWYPTVRLFRQSQPGDWTGVLEQAAQALEHREWISRSSHSE